MAQMKAIVDKLLTNASSAYIPEGFISDSVLPTIQSKQNTGKLGKYGTDFLRIENTIRGGRGAYQRVDVIKRTTDSYDIEGHGLEGIVTEDDYDNVELPFDAEKDEVMGLSTMLAVGKEKALADTLTDTAVLTQNTTLAGTDQYSDYLNSDPIDDFNTARETVKAGAGIAPNVAILSWEVFNKLKFHPGLLDALGYKDNRPGGLKGQELADVLEVKKIFIAEAMYESAKEGQTGVLAPIWGKHMVFAVLPEQARKYQVSLGYLVRKMGRPSRRVTKWTVNNPPNSKAILVDDAYDMFISNALAGYLIKDAVA